MLERTFTIRNALGMHARAAARFVHAAGAYRCRVTVTRADRGDRRVDGKSILGLLLLAASKGTNLRLRVEGDDEEAALAAVKDLVDRRFDESE